MKKFGINWSNIKWPHMAVWAAVGFVFGLLFYNIVMKG